MNIQDNFKKAIADFLKISPADIATIDYRWDNNRPEKNTVYVEFYEGLQITHRYISDGKAWK